MPIAGASTIPMRGNGREGVVRLADRSRRSRSCATRGSRRPIAATQKKARRRDPEARLRDRALHPDRRSSSCRPPIARTSRASDHRAGRLSVERREEVTSCAAGHALITAPRLTAGESGYPMSAGALASSRSTRPRSGCLHRRGRDRSSTCASDMFGYIVRRLLATIPVMAVVAFFVFSLLYLTPGDPAAVIAGDIATVEDIARIRAPARARRALSASTSATGSGACCTAISASRSSPTCRSRS